MELVVVERRVKYNLFSLLKLLASNQANAHNWTFFGDSFPEWPLRSFESLLFGLLRHKL
jgi:hypothetical protein